MSLSYLVSTAGHAQHQNEQNPHDIETILQLIQSGVEEFGDEKVIGFTTLEDKEWRCDQYSFPDLLDLSDKVAASLINRVPSEGIVSLLCPTGLEFLVTWIALMRLGHGAVLVAPQCSPTAIVSLYHASESKCLIYHSKYQDLAESAKLLDVSIVTTPLTPSTVDSESPLTASTYPARPGPDSVSHVFHTSGTSGNPKPIFQYHGPIVKALPRRALPTYFNTQPSSLATRDLPSESAAFTTTPLFHGGISDLLRAWMARSMIYFYPTSDVPVTADYLIQAISTCTLQSTVNGYSSMDGDYRKKKEAHFRVTSFLSVPYILTVLADDPKGMEMLAGLDYVSTGGAPLDTAIGDRMVGAGVPLVSRLGSSECGFLMSSHRSYASERDWEWLRNDSPYSSALLFEKTDHPKRFQMVVTNGWKSKAKSNKPNGDYATGDLYIAHPEKKNVWKYVGRGDDVIVLSNGEKASPGPIEIILRSSLDIADALVVGADRDQLGILIFPKTHTRISDDIIQALLIQANSISPSFAQISIDMCHQVIDLRKSLPKSSKGTIQRGVAYDLFKEEIDGLYTSGETGGGRKRTLEEIQRVLKQMVLDVALTKRISGSLDLDTDLSNWGIDSLLATRLRNGIGKTIDTRGTPIPGNIVYEMANIRRLAKYLYDLQEGKTGETMDYRQEMWSLVDKYGSFESTAATIHQKSPKLSGKTILLTGGTGSLGCAFIQALMAVESAHPVDRVICLVRASNDGEARKRLKSSLSRRGIAIKDRVKAYASSTSSSSLGLTDDVYNALQQDVDIIMHAAWPVHFSSGLSSFEESFQGLRNLLKLASSSHAQLVFCSSIASATNVSLSHGPVKEEVSEDPSTASPIGYSRSKWVAERICYNAKEAGINASIFRIGQLCGDTISGYWNQSEGWPLMIRTGESTGCLPLLTERPSWLPVDVAARVMLDIALPNEYSQPPPFIPHILHPKHLDWNNVLDDLEATGLEFSRVEPKEWLKKVDVLPEDDPSKGMLSMWQAAYGGDAPASPSTVDTTKACETSKTLREASPVDRVQIGKMVKSWKASRFLS